MEKMLFFAKILSEELGKVYDLFYDAGYKVLSFSGDYATYDAYLKHGGTKLRMKNNQYILLEELYEEMELDQLLSEVQTDEEREVKLEDYSEDYGTEESGELVGILFPTVFLYEILYDFGMLGDEFYDEEKDKAVQVLLRTMYKIAGAFHLDLHFEDGRIYITSVKEPLDDGSFICQNMAEVDGVSRLRKGVGMLEVREASGMSDEEWESFMERLREHEWRQTSACEDEAYMEKLKQRGWR